MEVEADTLQELLEFTLPKFQAVFEKEFGQNADVTPDKFPKVMEALEVKISEEQAASLMENSIGMKKMPYKLFKVYIKSTIVRTEYTTLELIKKVPVSHDTAVFEFVLPSDKNICGHHFGDYMLVKCEVGNDIIEKKYTPINHPMKPQWLKLLIKNKNAGASKFFHDLEMNDLVEFKGPYPQFRWTPKSFRRIGMVCGGTGIAPMLPIIEQLIHDKSDKTKISLIYHNKCEKDILFYHKLKEFSKDPRFHVVHIISKSFEKSHFIKGPVNTVAIQTFLPKPNPNNIVFICGPQGFGDHVQRIIKELKYPKFHVFES